ncbi:MAG: LysO family transporter [Rikenellaceae bacterium]
MLKILGILVIGVGVGFLLRQHLSLRLLSKAIMWLIYLLLLILGVAVGANETIISNLGTIGVKGAVIAIGAVLGSMLMAKLLYHLLYKKNER